MRTETVLATAAFDRRLPKYCLLMSTIALIGGIFTIPLIPFWLFLFGPPIHRRQYEALSLVLTDRTLNIQKGFLLKTQKNIPLDKITDLAVNEGPVLRHLGLCSLQVETAGGGQGNAMGHASLPGVVDALEFRDMVLEQRDKVCGVGGESGPRAASESESSRELLVEIRDLLAKIERRGSI